MTLGPLNFMNTLEYAQSQHITMIHIYNRASCSAKLITKYAHDIHSISFQLFTDGVQ